MGKGLLFIFLLTLHISVKAAEVTCLVADFKAVLDVPPVQREPTAFQWINTIGNDCSYEQLEAIKNNLGSWLGTANSPRVSTALARQLEAYYVAKNEWNEDLYTSRAAFVAPYDAGTKTAQTNTIVPPNYQNLYQFGQPPKPVWSAFQSRLSTTFQFVSASWDRLSKPTELKSASESVWHKSEFRKLRRPKFRLVTLKSL